MESMLKFCLIFGFFMILQSAENQALKIEENKEGLASHSVSRREVSGDVLIYPEDNPTPPKVSQRRDVVQQLKPSPCPKDALFCEDADDYPLDHIKNVLEKQPDINVNNFYVETQAVEVERFGNPDETSLCPSVTQTVYPKKGQSIEGVFEFIVNEENHKQAIIVETCGKDGEACKIPGSLSLGYTSHCRQKNIVRKLIVVNRNLSDVEGFITKPFEVPSCCACMISMKSDRFGFGFGQSTTPANITNTVKG